MPTSVAVLDANVLYSIEVTDVLLTLAARRTIRVHWSPEIVDEVRRNLRLRPDLSSAAIDDRIEQMDRALPGASDEAPAAIVESMPVNDKDRHVLGLAVHVEADVIVTENVRDFPVAACEPFGIEALTADEYLTRVSQQDGRAVRAALGEVAARRRHPAMTVENVLDRLARTLPQFVAALDRRQG